MTIPRWTPIGNTTRLIWKRDSVTCCYIGKVFHVRRHRNSYNLSSSVNYFVEGAFHPTLEDAKHYVDARREKGGSWTIDEYPALVICGKKYAICVASTESEEQFKYVKHSVISHKTLARIVAAIRHFSTSEIFLYRTRLDEVGSLTSPLARYFSESDGGEYLLWWAGSRKSDVHLSHIFDLQKKIWSLI